MRKAGVCTMMLVLALVLGACGNKAMPQEATAERAAAPTGPSVEILSPVEGAEIGSDASVEVKVSGLEVIPADGDTSGKTGHLHVFIDRDPVAAGQIIPKEPGVVHSAVSPIALSGLAPGPHTLTVVLGDGTHARIGSHEDSVEFEVKA